MKPLSIAVLPEDKGCEVLLSLVKKMLYLIDPAVPLYDPNRVLLIPAIPQAREAFRGNGWQSPAQRQKRVDVLQFIHSQLKRRDVEGFIIVHVDGDRPYAQSKEGSQSHNQEMFKKLIMSKLYEDLRDSMDLLSRILVVVPFYSVEAWLYQNTAVALRLYYQNYRTHTQDIARFERWQETPDQLDEVDQPKQSVSIGDRFNRELACDGFPAARVYGVKKSFFQSVERLRECRPLLAALEAVKNDAIPALGANKL